MGALPCSIRRSILPEASLPREDAGQRLGGGGEYAHQVVRAAAEASARGSSQPIGWRVWQALGSAGLTGELYRRPGAPPDSVRLAGLAQGLIDGLNLSDCVSAALSTCTQACMVVPALADDRRGELACRVREEMLSGRTAIGLAVTDAGGGGSDLLTMKTAVNVAEKYIMVDGSKQWITAATFAEFLLVLARHRPGRHFTNLTWLLVPTKAPGVTVEPVDSPFFQGAGLGHARLEQVRLDRRFLVGAVGRGMSGFTRHVAAERLAGGYWALALSRRIIGQTYRYLQTQEVGGRPLCANEAVSQRFGRCLLEYRKLDALCRGQIDHRGDPVMDGLLAKAAGADALRFILAECAQLYGAAAFAASGLQILRAEAAVLDIAGGPVELILGSIAEHADALLEPASGFPLPGGDLPADASANRGAAGRRQA
jgi:alkylation response protein AidB-like acyl-CoA dehydrogenase